MALLDRNIPCFMAFWPKTYPVLWTNFHKVALFMKNSVKVVFLDDTPFSTQFFGEIKYDVLFYEDWWDIQTLFYGISRGKRTLFYGNSGEKGPCFMANLGEKDPVLWQISEKRTLFVGASPYREYMGVPSPGTTLKQSTTLRTIGPIYILVTPGNKRQTSSHRFFTLWRHKRVNNDVHCFTSSEGACWKYMFCGKTEPDVITYSYVLKGIVYI